MTRINFRQGQRRRPTIENPANLPLNETPTNAGGYHVQYATNLLSPVVWQRFSGNPATNAGNFHQTIGPPVGSAAFFRLSTGSP